MALLWSRRELPSADTPQSLSEVAKAIIYLLAIRVAATVVASFRHFGDAVAAVPRNWFRSALCTDMAHTPEPLPGSETSANPRDFRLSSTMALEGWLDFALLVGAAVPTFLFRWSLKVTSIIYVPLIRKNMDSIARLGIAERVRRIREAKARVAYSIGGPLILFTAVPILVAGVATEIQRVGDVNPVTGRLLGFFTVVPHLEMWNVARVLAAGLTVLMFVVAGWVQRSLTRGGKLATNRTGVALGWGFRGFGFLRGLLDGYLLACGAILACRILRVVKMPTFGLEVFP